VHRKSRHLGGVQNPLLTASFFFSSEKGRSNRWDYLLRDDEIDSGFNGETEIKPTRHEVLWFLWNRAKLIQENHQEEK
jgi:hypothetical protein